MCIPLLISSRWTLGIARSPSRNVGYLADCKFCWLKWWLRIRGGTRWFSRGWRWKSGWCAVTSIFFNKKHILGLKITDFIEAEKQCKLKGILPGLTIDISFILEQQRPHYASVGVT